MLLTALHGMGGYYLVMLFLIQYEKVEPKGSNCLTTPPLFPFVMEQMLPYLVVVSLGLVLVSYQIGLVFNGWLGYERKVVIRYAVVPGGILLLLSLIVWGMLPVFYQR
jgi:hypothetical protein